MSQDTAHPRSAASGGYVSLVVRIWVSDDGELIRGTIEDVHTGARLAIDLSTITTFLRASVEDALKSAPGIYKEREAHMTGEQQNDLREKRPPDADHSIPDEANSEEEGM